MPHRQSEIPPMMITIIVMTVHIKLDHLSKEVNMVLQVLNDFPLTVETDRMCCVSDWSATIVGGIAQLALAPRTNHTGLLLSMGRSLSFSTEYDSKGFGA